MREFLPDNLLKLADVCQFSLYIIGGSVRDYLCGFPVRDADLDLCAAAEEEEMLSAAEKCGFKVRAVYRNTGTIKLEDENGTGYEFTRFRSDKYVRGVHTPSEITFTSDMGTDARRRDFTCNAVYYDIAKGEFRDPLGGMSDIAQKCLRTVAPAKKVFGEDGLRLMRLCRLAAQLGFSPDGECLDGAREHADLIRDIAPERVFAELTQLLLSDTRHGFRDAPYRGLCLMRDTGVLARVLPELALGDGMKQRPDFHDHDVLEHSFRCVRYSPPEIRFAALFHDVGKPFCMIRDGNYHAHAEEGTRLTEEILGRLKAPKKLIRETARLVSLHMRDLDGKMKESKIRREIVRDYDILPRLFALRQADFSACKDDLSVAPSVKKWTAIVHEMQAEGVPFTLSALAVNGKELQEAGVPVQKTAAALADLLRYTAGNGARNRKEELIRRAVSLFKEDL